MSKRSTHHATFAIERTYEAPRERVFSALADRASKSHWSREQGTGKRLDALGETLAQEVAAS